MNTEKIKQNKVTLILIGVALLVLILGFVGYQKFIAGSKENSKIATDEVDLTFDPEGPYALLVPRRDGNAMNVNLIRTSSYEGISYELAYSDADGIDRGVTGQINVEKGKSEYNQEVLFGTCSKNVCKYDKGVENGTLTLHIQKGSEKYRMITQWHLQNTATSSGKLTSGDEHFSYQLAKVPTQTKNNKISDEDFGIFTIINDLTGAPKLPNDKDISSKVYTLNVPAAKTLESGTVMVELASTPKEGSKIVRWNESGNKWDELETKTEGSKLSAPAQQGGIFTVLSSK